MDLKQAGIARTTVRIARGFMEGIYAISFIWHLSLLQKNKRDQFLTAISNFAYHAVVTNGRQKTGVDFTLFNV